MRTVRFFVVGLTLALPACARDPFPAIQSSLDELKGQPAQAIIAKLGAPDETDQEGDAKTYVWYRLDKSAPEFQADFLHCTIKVDADKDDRITGFFYTGNKDGCGRFAHELDESFEQPRKFLGL